METPTLNTAKFICNSWFMFNGVRTCAMKNGTHPSCIAASNPDYVCGMNIETVATPNSGCPYRIQDTCHFKGSCNNISCNIRANHVESLQSSPQEKEYPEAFVEWMYERYSKYWGSDIPNNNKWYARYTTPEKRKYYTLPELLLYWKENINQK